MGEIEGMFSDAGVTAPAVEAPAPAPVAPVEAAPVAPVAQEVPVADATAPDPAAEAAPPSPPPTKGQTPLVPLTRVHAQWRETQKAQKALEAAQATIAELEAKVAQSLAAQNPAAAAEANKTAESKADWIQQMLDGGAEVPEELVANLRKMQERLDKLDAAANQHGQFVQTARQREAESNFNSNFQRLQERAPHFTEEELLGFIKDGVPAARIIAHNDTIAAKIPQAAPVAAAARPAGDRVPTLDAPATPSAPSRNDGPWTIDRFMSEFRNDLH
jgi:plasmid stabilization system protein ParE